MTLANRLVEKRNEKGLSQGALAELVGVKQQSIDQIERGETKKPRYIEKLAFILDVSASWLLFGEEGNLENINKNKIPLKSWTLAETTEKIIPPIPVSKDAYALRVKDEQMCTTDRLKMNFIPGTIVIIEPTSEEVKASKYIDKYVLIKVNSSGTILLRQVKDWGDQITYSALHSLANSPEEGKAEIIGVVVASMNLDL